jgi:hypothetical protein
MCTLHKNKTEIFIVRVRHKSANVPENINDLNFCRAMLTKVELSIMLSFIF